MEIINLYPGSLGSNCYLLEEGGQALVVDPSASAAAILRRVEADGCTLAGVILTHGHFDHVMSIDTLRDAVPGLRVYLHEGDAPMLTDGHKNAFATFFGQDRAWREADSLLREGDTLTVGSTNLEVLHTPGHSPGSICLLSREDGVLFTGDTLFSDNVGRWDLWGGSEAVLRQSLARLGTLDRRLTIYPGHGDTGHLGSALDMTRIYF